MRANWTPIEDLVDVEAITALALDRPHDPGIPLWENVIYTIDFAFSALPEEFELRRKELPYAEINDFGSLHISLQILKKVLGDQLRRRLPLGAEAEKYLQLKVWGKVRTPAGHLEREEPHRFKKIPKEPGELDRKIQTEMLRKGIKWP